MVGNGMTRIKICGVTNLVDAFMAVQLGADAIGFIFTDSKRKVSPQIARSIIRRLPPMITTVGVFMNTSSRYVNKIAEYTGVDIVQLHGDESSEYCSKIAKRVIKRIAVKRNDTRDSLIGKIQGYNVSAFLFDPGAGNGQTFDWRIAQGISCRPIIIAGGLSPHNVKEVITLLNPYGVDVASGVETLPGKKDREKLKKFIEEVRSC